MKKIILWILFGMAPILFQMELLRAQSVSISTNTYPVKAGGTICTGSGTTISGCRNLISETRDGSSDSPHQAYVPLFNKNNSGNHKYSLLWDETSDATSDVMPFYNSSLPGSSGNIVTQLLIKGSSGKTTYYLYGGVLDQERKTFQVYKNGSLTYFEKFEDYEDTTIGNRYVKVDLETLCANPFFTNCSGEVMEINLDRSNSEKKAILFFFLSKNEDISTESAINLTDEDIEGTGVFIEYRMRNYVYTDTRVVLKDLFKGDLRLTADYEREDITELYALVAYKTNNGYSVGGPRGDATSDSGMAKNLSEVLKPDKSSEIDIFPLFNDKEYSISLALVDKWQFVTNLTPQKTETTEALNVFLQKEACYFISAGFKKKHFVLDYFRSIRDDILLKSSWGRTFVKFYYRTAPYYAQNYIYPSKVLSFLVRFFSYILYYFLSNLVFILLILSGLAYLLIYRRRGRKKMTPW